MDRQRGLSLIGGIIMLMAFGSLAMCVIKLFPAYFEYMGVKRSIESLAADPEINGQGPRDVYRKFANRLQVNNIAAIQPQDLKVERKDGKYTFKVQYESRTHLFHNVHVVLTFDKEAHTR